MVESRVHNTMRDKSRLKRVGTTRSIMNRTNDFKILRHWKFYLSQIGFKIALKLLIIIPRRLSEWFFVLYSLAREAVLKVRVGPTLLWLLNQFRLESSYFVPYILCNHYKTNFLYSHGAGYRYFKDSSTINPGLFCCEKAVAPPNKKIIIRRIWRFSGMAQFY